MNNKDDINILKLKRVSNEIVLGMVKGILDDNDIPYIIKDKGPVGYSRVITGGSHFGADIMVAEADFQKAKDLLESIGMG
ncbi:MAG: DUF2007 domain-containing protein [Clostridiales bacterium]|nr:DUF2007 domain-containing protein [Clostridiales bacterium]